MHYPLLFEPSLKTRVWGGDLLPRLYGKPSSEPVGEAWLLSDHGADSSRVANGALKGKTLHELLLADKAGLLGRAVDASSPNVFPLMLKTLDSRDSLSVQVHPDDAYAQKQKPGELGKTESWFILDADKDACIYHGLKNGTTRERLARAMRDGTVESCLLRVAVRPGEVYHIPAGTVHALGAGVRIAEIQQNSDTTYRLFDWNRAGLDGKPRQLHIEDGLETSDFSAPGGKPEAAREIPAQGCRRERFVACEKFAFDKLSRFAPEAKLQTSGSFHLIFALEKPVTVTAGGVAAEVGRWQCCLVPAGCAEYTVKAGQGGEALLFCKEV